VGNGMSFTIPTLRRLVKDLDLAVVEIKKHGRIDFKNLQVDEMLEPKVEELNSMIAELKPQFEEDRGAATYTVDKAVKTLEIWKAVNGIKKAA